MFFFYMLDILQYVLYILVWSVRVAERLALPTSDHGVAGSNPAGGEILPEPKRRFIAQKRLNGASLLKYCWRDVKH